MSSSRQEGASAIPCDATTPCEDPKDARAAGSAGRVALASSAATVLTKSLLHPLDTIKCRVQIYSQSTEGNRDRRHAGLAACHSAGASASAGPASSAPRRPLSLPWRWVQRSQSVWRDIRHQYAGKWGPAYLYGGLPVKLVFYVPYQAAYMTSYGASRAMFVEYAETSSASPASSVAVRQETISARQLLACTIAAAVVAELSSCVVRVPMETLKMRIQSTAATGTVDAVRQLQRNGLRACARLAAPQTLMHDIPYSIVQWSAYERLRPGWNISSPDTHSEVADNPLSRYRKQIAQTFLSGGFSGLMAAAVTVPLDNIRTRVVVATARDPRLRVRDVVQAAYKSDGLLGFVRGGSMRVLWVTANMACYFPLFELCRALLIQ